MADEQILTSCVWTNGDATVVCSGETFNTDLSANDVVKVDVDGQPPYTVGSVTDDEHFELTSPFAGTTGTYTTVLQRSFTINLHLERPQPGDHGWGELLANVFDKIDGYLGYLINSTYAAILKLTRVQGTDHTFSGDYFEGTAGENLVFGDLVYLKSDGKYWKSNATAAGTMPGIAMAVATISADADGNLLKRGFVRDDSWTWATIGANLWAGETNGTITDVQPSDTGDQVQCIGQVIDDDNIWFEPTLVVVEV
jgi:hypothetical protein